MPLDYVFLTAIKDELSQNVLGAKIEKVQQPARGDVVLYLKGTAGRKALFLGGGSGSGRVNLTRLEYEKPQEPPMFCMLLRKHLVGARITGIEMPPMERVIMMDLDAPGMFGEGEKRGLVVELISRTANVILTDGEGIITDCLYRIGSAEEKRAVLPGMRYRLPDGQNKLSPENIDEGSFADLYREADGSLPLEKWLVRTFAGISPLTAREIAWRSCGDTSVRMENVTHEQVCEQVAAVTGALKGEYAPYMISDKDGMPFDFSYMPILQYGPEYTITKFDSFSELLESFWGKKDEETRRRQRSADLAKSVKGIRDRTARRLEAQRHELGAAEGRETMRENGDLITSNLHLMKKGMGEIVCQDYYSPDGGERRIKLDPLKTPQQNAAQYYRAYRKLKSAEEHLIEQIEKGETELYYLDSVLDEISRAESQRDVAEIRAELMDCGVIKKRGGGKKERRTAPSGPMRFRSDSGYEIRVGRNNVQNDRLTLKDSAKTDLWLHAQKIHGSHVVISCGGAKPDDRTVEEAASLAAYFSQASDSGKVPVDCTYVKYVKKPSGARPGMVIYTEYRTFFAEPDRELVEKLKEK